MKDLNSAVLLMSVVLSITAWNIRSCMDATVEQQTARREVDAINNLTSAVRTLDGSLDESIRYSGRQPVHIIGPVQVSGTSAPVCRCACEP